MEKLSNRNTSPKYKKEDDELPSDEEEFQEDEMDADLQDEEAEEDEEDYEVAPKSKKRKRPDTGRVVKSKKKNKRAKKGKVITTKDLFDFEAEESDEDEEDEFDDDAELNQAEADKIMEERVTSSLHYRPPRETFLQNEDDEESMQKILEKLERRVHDDDEAVEGQTDTITQQGLLPSIKDPKLWLVRCKPGCEREAVVSLMAKSFFKKQQQEPLEILSATCSDNVKGYIYVEAFKDIHVKTAVRGLRSLYESFVELVPLQEMSDVYGIDKAHTVDVKAGQWVRIKNGPYAGDLANIKSVDDQKTRAVIKIIPRLDISADANEKSATGRKKTKRSMKLPQRIFHPDDFTHVEKKRNPQDGKPYYYWNNMMFRNGLLVKPISTKTLIVDSIVPTLEEIEKFKSAVQENQGDDDDENYASDNDMIQQEEGMQLSELKKQQVNLTKGDIVRVIKGELKNLIGIVISIKEGQANIQPNNPEITSNLSFSLDSLVKYFSPGDHCKVINGMHKGETGLIIKIENDIAYLFTDDKSKEIKVFIHDLKLATESSVSTLATAQKFAAFDLVSYNNNKNIGVILSIERETARILNNMGEVKLLKVHELKKRVTTKSVGIDSQNHTVSQGDVIKVVNGTNSGKKGTVKHILKSTVFMQDTADFPHTNGMFVENIKNCILLGSEFIRQAGGKGARSANIRRKDDLIGTMVKILGGPRKGYIGVVTSCNDKYAQIELTTKSKIVAVDKTLIAPLDQDTKKGFNTPLPDIRTPGPGVKTPAYYPHSPSWGGPTTPGYASPGYNNAERNVWNPTSPAYTATPRHEFNSGW